MSVKPDLAMMTAPQLRAYVLDHWADEEALQAYLE
jgi:quinol monooxygenase YgiN